MRACSPERWASLSQRELGKIMALARKIPTRWQELEQEKDIEKQEWLESLDAVLASEGPERALFLLGELRARAQAAGISLPPELAPDRSNILSTPYVNTIPLSRQ